MNWTDVLFDPRVLVTFIVTAFLAFVVASLVMAFNRRKQEEALSGQRRQQEEAVSRILDSVTKSKDELIADYEGRLAELQERFTFQEKENARLKERISQGGILGMFGGRQRDVVSALLLENEQLHELLEQRQVQTRQLLGDLTGKLLDRLDEQIEDTSHAIRYKQVLLSAFLQQEEARKLLDRFVGEGRLSIAERAQIEAPTEPAEEKTNESQ